MLGQGVESGLELVGDPFVVSHEFTIAAHNSLFLPEKEQRENPSLSIAKTVAKLPQAQSEKHYFAREEPAAH